MNHISIYLDKVKETDGTIVEIANEIRDISIRASKLDYTDVAQDLGIVDKIYKARFYLDEACNQTIQLRQFIKNAVSLYEGVENRLAFQNGDVNYLVTKAFQKIDEFYSGEAFHNHILDSRMERINQRLDEEDYGYSIYYYYDTGDIQIYSEYKDFDREYVGANYDKNTGELLGYDIRKQHIGEGSSVEYIFANKNTYKNEKLKDVTNYYDGKERVKEKSGDYDIKEEHIGSMEYWEATEPSQATKIVDKTSIYQDLTDWDVENSKIKLGDVDASTTSDGETKIVYMKGEGMNENIDNWTKRRTLTTTNSEKREVVQGYLSADILGGTAGIEKEFTIAGFDTKYETKKEDKISAIDAGLTAGHFKASAEGGANVLNSEGKIDTKAYGSAEIGASVLESVFKYSQTDLSSGNELISTEVKGTIFGVNGSKNVGFKDNSVKLSKDIPTKGVKGIAGLEVSGTMDFINSFFNQDNVDLRLFGKEDSQ